MDKDRFAQFSDDELYIIKRTFIESCWNFYSGEYRDYDDVERAIHKRLLNETIESFKCREHKQI